MSKKSRTFAALLVCAGAYMHIHERAYNDVKFNKTTI